MAAPRRNAKAAEDPSLWAPIQTVDEPISTCSSSAPPISAASAAAIALFLTAASCGLAPLPLTVYASQACILGAAPLLMGIIACILALSELRNTGCELKLSLCNISVVTSGVYSLTRNPLYFGVLLSVAGLGICFNTWWGALWSAPLFMYFHYYVIPYEEAVLRATWGARWKYYAGQTPRWLL